MKKLLLMTLFAAMAFVGCKDDTENNTPNSGINQMEQMLVGRWQEIRHEGYETYKGEYEEWDEDMSNSGSYVEFRANGTATVSVGVMSQNVWWSVEDSKLYFKYAANQEMDFEGDITELTATTLVTEYYSDIVSTRYYKTTYRRVE